MTSPTSSFIPDRPTLAYHMPRTADVLRSHCALALYDESHFVHTAILRPQNSGDEPRVIHISIGRVKCYPHWHAYQQTSTHYSNMLQQVRSTILGGALSEKLRALSTPRSKCIAIDDVSIVITPSLVVSIGHGREGGSSPCALGARSPAQLRYRSSFLWRHDGKVRSAQTRSTIAS